MKVIIINGPMGVGKTTVGKYIAQTHPGTAFIDGDWCMDIHPFVGSDETRAMAADNILHMMGNYQKCSAVRMIVLVWLMDDARVLRRIEEGASALDLELRSVTLTCGRDELVRRWKNDTLCPWRTDEWLAVSLKSLESFAALENCVDTEGLTIEQAAGAVMG